MKNPFTSLFPKSKNTQPEPAIKEMSTGKGTSQQAPSSIPNQSGEEVRNPQAKPKILNPNDSLKDKNLSVVDVISPQQMEVDFDYLKINDVYFRTLFVSGYPRFVAAGWLEQVINFDSSLDISFYVFPVEAKGILDELRHKIAEMEAEIATDLERGKIVNPSTQAKLDDARVLQEELVKGAEHFYEFGFYITIPSRSLEDLNDITKQVQSTLGSLLINSNFALLDMESGFLSTSPLGL